MFNFKRYLTLKHAITPVKGFIAWKVQIPIREVTAAKTGKYKRHTDVALKKERSHVRKAIWLIKKHMERK